MVGAGLGRTGGFGVFTIQAICTHLDGLCVPWVATKPAGGVSGMVTGFAAWRYPKPDTPGRWGVRDGSLLVATGGGVARGCSWGIQRWRRLILCALGR